MDIGVVKRREPVFSVIQYGDIWNQVVPDGSRSSDPMEIIEQIQRRFQVEDYVITASKEQRDPIIEITYSVANDQLLFPLKTVEIEFGDVLMFNTETRIKDGDLVTKYTDFQIVDKAEFKLMYERILA